MWPKSEDVRTAVISTAIVAVGLLINTVMEQQRRRGRVEEREQFMLEMENLHSTLRVVSDNVLQHRTEFLDYREGRDP